MKLNIILTMFFLLMATACSSKFAYDNLDWIAQWYLDDYLELNYQQNKLLEKRLDHIHDWHRREELSKYRDHLILLRGELDTLPLSEQKILKHMGIAHNHWKRIRQQINHSLIGDLVLLDEAQLDYLFSKLERKNKQDLEGFNDQTTEERKQQRYDQIIESINDRLGSVLSEQEVIVKQFVERVHFTTPLYIKYLRSFQGQLQVLTAKQEANKHEANQQDIYKKELLALMDNRSMYRSSEFDRLQQLNRENSIKMMAEVSALMTPKQTDYLRRELNQWIELLNELNDGVEEK